MGCVAAQCRHDRQGQENVNRDQDRIEPVPFDRDQIILQRQYDKKGGGQRQVIAAPGTGQGQEFAQCGKRGEREEHDDAGLAQGEGEADQRDHHPPRLDPGVQVADDRAFGVAKAQNETDE
jgi:hypothetical protein